MLKGKSALVTGSSTGIGFEIAKAFLQAGAFVMLQGTQPRSEMTPKLKLLQETVPNSQLPNYFSMDLTLEPNCSRLVSLTTKFQGQVDILVNNAAISHEDLFQDIPPAEWAHLLRLNLTAPFWLTKAVLPQMYERGWGRVISIGGANSLVGSEMKAAYTAAKHGLVGFSKVVALEGRGKGVTSNTICPGYTTSPLFGKRVKDYARWRGTSELFAQTELMKEKQPSGSTVEPEQMAGLAVFLCSEEGRAVTGAAFSMDGGWTAR